MGPRRAECEPRAGPLAKSRINVRFTAHIVTRTARQRVCCRFPSPCYRRGVALARGVAAAHACCGLAATHARVPPGPGHVGRRRWPNDRCISRHGPLRPDFARRVRRQQREWLVAHTPRADSLARAVRGALPRVSELQLCVLLEGEGHFASPCSSNPNLYSLETQPSPRPSLILHPSPSRGRHSTAASSQP